MDTSPLATYTSDLHKHRVACWAASRAASVPFRYTFRVSTGRDWLHAGLRIASADAQAREVQEHKFVLAINKAVERIHSRDSFDDWHHRVVTELLRSSATIVGRRASYGVAAKLLNVYLKLYFLRQISGSKVGEKFSHFHPPLDSIMIKRFQRLEGAQDTEIVDLSPAWSTFGAENYRATIDVMRRFAGRTGHPLWKIEAYWTGFRE